MCVERVLLTASISLRAFHCSYGTPRCSAVWMLQHSWLVQIFRFFSCCSSTNPARDVENYMGQTAFYHLVAINLSSNLSCPLWLFLPVYPAVRGLRRHLAVPLGCLCSLHADTGRWFGAGRGCSSGNRQSYSGCDPGSG